MKVKRNNFFTQQHESNEERVNSMERQLRRLDELEESEHHGIPVVQKRHHHRANANFEAHRNELI